MYKVVMLLFPLVAFFLVACNTGQPQITVETTLIDLGDVVNGEIIIRDVTVQNKGGKELVIESIATSCACTQATLEPRTIPPGQHGTLHIEFDTGAHGPALNGALTRQVFIASNDPEEPETVIELAVNIFPPAAP